MSIYCQEWKCIKFTDKQGKGKSVTLCLATDIRWSHLKNQNSLQETDLFHRLGFAESYYLVNGTKMKDLGLTRAVKQVDLVVSWAQSDKACLTAHIWSPKSLRQGQGWAGRLGFAELCASPLHFQHRGLYFIVSWEARTVTIQIIQIFQSSNCNRPKCQVKMPMPRFSLYREGTVHPSVLLGLSSSWVDWKSRGARAPGCSGNTQGSYSDVHVPDRK